MRSVTKLTWVVAVVLCTKAPVASAEEVGDVSLVVREPGKPEYELKISAIKHAADAHKQEKTAAAELGRYLCQMTGARIPVGPRQPTDTAKGTFMVGRAAVATGVIPEKELPWCGFDGYLVSAKPDRVGIAGQRPRGTLYGVYHFLEDLGARFFAHGCERVPKIKSPVLTYSIRKNRPFFALRTTGSIKQGGGTLYGMIGNPINAVKKEERKHYPRLWIDHTAGFLVPTYKHFKTHPEYFSHDGKGKVLFDIGTEKSVLNPFGDDLVNRRTDMVWLCMSHPDVRKIATEKLLDWISKQPDHQWFSIHQGDSNFPCRCDGCKKVGNVMDNMVAFANALAGPVKQRFPDRLLMIFAYANTMDVIPTIKPADNVIILFAPIDAKSKIHSCLDPDKNALFRAKFMKWYAYAPDNLGVYEYNDAAIPFLEKMITAFQQYHKHGLKGVFYCGNKSLMYELFTYVNAKLLWDPQQDPETLIQEFCSAFYGPAGPAMAEFVKLKRAQVRRPGFSFAPIYGAGLGRDFYTKDFDAQAIAVFGKAEEEAKGEAGIVARVRKIQMPILTGMLRAWDWTDPELSAADRAEYAGYLKEYLRISADPAGKPPKLAGFLWGTASLRVKEPWQEDPLIKSFLADPAGTLERQRAEIAKLRQKEIPGGWQLPLNAFRGGTGPVYYRWMCPGKMMKGVYARKTGKHTMSARLFLKEAPAGEYRVMIEGQNHDKDNAEATRIRIKMNDHVLFEGRNRFVKRGWSQETYKFPAAALRKGQNVLTIENTEEEAVPHSMWFIVSEVKVLAGP